MSSYELRYLWQPSRDLGGQVEGVGYLFGFHPHDAYLRPYPEMGHQTEGVQQVIFMTEKSFRVLSASRALLTSRPLLGDVARAEEVDGPGRMPTPHGVHHNDVPALRQGFPVLVQRAPGLNGLHTLRETSPLQFAYHSGADTVILEEGIAQTDDSDRGRLAVPVHRSVEESRLLLMAGEDGLDLLQVMGKDKVEMADRQAGDG